MLNLQGLLFVANVRQPNLVPRLPPEMRIRRIKSAL